MAKLDDANTTGFYTEQIACTLANGFEDGKSYTIYIEATVDGDTGGICYGFSTEAHDVVTLTGTANAGDSTVQITLTGGVATDGYYNGQTVVITGGTGVGQARTILSYLAAGTVATPTRDWAVAPDATSVFVVLATDVPSILEAGKATAGGVATITLDATASATADIYKNNFIMITGGTGTGQTRLIGAYNGGTRVATIVPNWTTNPDNTSIYQVLPMARVDIAGVAGTLQTAGDLAALVADVQSRVPAALSGGNMASDVLAVSTSTDAADKLEASAETIVLGTVSHDNTVATTTVFYSDDITEATADHFNGRIVIFTSGDLIQQATDITDYELEAGEGKFTVTTLTELPADNVTFVIV
jgi:hypothetical protein